MCALPRPPRRRRSCVVLTQSSVDHSPRAAFRYATAMDWSFGAAGLRFGGCLGGERPNMSPFQACASDCRYSHGSRRARHSGDGSGCATAAEAMFDGKGSSAGSGGGHADGGTVSVSTAKGGSGKGTISVSDQTAMRRERHRAGAYSMRCVSAQRAERGCHHSRFRTERLRLQRYCMRSSRPECRMEATGEACLGTKAGASASAPLQSAKMARRMCLACRSLARRQLAGGGWGPRSFGASGARRHTFDDDESSENHRELR